MKKIEAKLRPVEAEQWFNEIWPSKLVFNPTWPVFKLDHDIIKSNFLAEFYEDWSKTVAPGVHTTFWRNLTQWPSFFIRHNPHSNLTKVLSSQIFKQCFTKIEAKLWPPGCIQGFNKIWPSDLLFYQIWPTFELDRDIIQTNILVKFHKDWIKTAASRDCTR